MKIEPSSEVKSGRVTQSFCRSGISERILRATRVGCLAAGLLLVLNCPVARGQMHPSEPAVNLGDTTFLDGIAGPGLLVEEIGDMNHSGKFADSAGRTSDSGQALNAISGLTHIAWLSKRSILSAWFGGEVIVPAAHVNAGSTGSAGGWGNIIVAPLILQWNMREVGPVAVYQRVGFDFFLPTGQYLRTGNVNLGSNAFAIDPYYAITALPTRHVETSWRFQYLWNSVNHAPPLASGARSTQAGQAVHLDGTAAYLLPHSVWVGANGYYLKQVTSPLVNGIQLDNSAEQVGAIGPGAMWDLGDFLLYADTYHEMGAVNRPEGNKLVVRVMWLPGRKAAQDKGN